VPAALSSAIAAKIDKHYGAQVSLLVYLNIGEFGIRQAEIEAAMAPAVTPALPCFEGSAEARRRAAMQLPLIAFRLK
jgi:hypothetical protein